MMDQALAFKSKFNGKKSRHDVHDEALDWYLQFSKKDGNEKKRFESFYDWPIYGLPNVSKESLLWTTNLSSVLFDLDDYLSFKLGNNEVINYDEITLKLFHSDHKIDTGDEYDNTLNGVQTALREFNKLCNHNYNGKMLYNNWEEWFHNAYFDRIISPVFNDVGKYIIYRRPNVGMKGFIDMVFIGLGYDFPIDIHLDIDFIKIKQLCVDHMGIMNDLCSQNREKKTEEKPCNILNIISAEEALILVENIEDRILALIEKLKTKKLNFNGIDYKAQVIDICENMKDMCAGNIEWSKVCKRYNNQEIYTA